MIFRICLLFSAIACHTSTALVFYKSAKVGEKVRLDLGAGYDTWRRERKPGVVEFIKRCAIGEKGPHCTNFVTLHVDASPCTVADGFGTSMPRHARSPTGSARRRLAMHGCRRVRCCVAILIHGSLKRGYIVHDLWNEVYEKNLFQHICK
ncbi:unnamed protein product [Heligmosomoides polygyrus]|uniref:Secreted protein n=1 Tax=Heligmosomoides polygyrus TaxID=6339 RepID=A0A183GFS9_HELPZ|nr:unnamed protein product [Heligmosomoides polygyrus]